MPVCDVCHENVWKLKHYPAKWFPNKGWIRVDEEDKEGRISCCEGTCEKVLRAQYITYRKEKKETAKRMEKFREQAFIEEL